MHICRSKQYRSYKIRIPSCPGGRKRGRERERHFRKSNWGIRFKFYNRAKINSMIFLYVGTEKKLRNIT
jgi:hypothetical protein